MAKSRSTFGKIQREQDKRARAKEKQERREERKEEALERATTPADSGSVDESKILLELAKIHEDLAEGRISFEDFEERQEELRAQLMG
jgi:hypothetical protein